MNLRYSLRFIFLICLLPCAWARYGAEDPRLEKLYSTFIAPCCWRENLTMHDSPVAVELRRKIQVMVQAGRSDEEIKAALVAEHTTRVLALPEGSPRIWLFLTPWVLLAASMAGLFAFLKRLREKSRRPILALAPAELEDHWDWD